MAEKDDLTFDFSRIKRIFKSKERGEKKEESKSEEFEIDKDKLISFSKRYGFVLLILIPIFLSFFFRIQPAILPITDVMAENFVQNNIMSNIIDQVSQQYPNLPSERINELASKEFTKVMEKQKSDYKKQVEAVSQQIKSHYQDDTGQTYLIAIDPYQYYRYTRDIIENGHIGDEIREEVYYDTHMIAPIGTEIEMNLHALIGAVMYKTMHFLNPETNIMKGVFYVPVLISLLAVIPAFFIARRFAGNVGGFFAAVLVAVHPNFLTRTVGGFSDTDAYNVLFPLLIVWLFIEAFESRDRTKKAVLAGLSGLSVGVYSFAWMGWWLIFDFLVITLIAYLIYIIVYKLWTSKKELTDYFKSDQFKNFLIVFVIFLIISGTFVTLFSGFNTFKKAPTQPITSLTLKQAAKPTLWPNVYTTVAELNEASIPTIISSIGSGSFPKFFFWLSLIGITLTLLAKDQKKHNTLFILASSIWFFLIILISNSIENPFVFTFLLGIPIALGIIFSIIKKLEIDIKFALVLIIWFTGTIIASTRGTRFILLLVPAYAIAFGITTGMIYKKLSKYITRELHVGEIISKTIIFLVLIVLIISPVGMGWDVAKQEVPTMNDAWYSALTKIKDNSKENAIINSWWDFGHWFKAIADRAVTFDGASQNRPQAHWIGKVLLTSNEDEALGILRMLDCGANTAFETLNEELDDRVKSIDILYQIIVLDREKAKKVLEEYVSGEKAEEILGKTHCQPPENFFITSEDMVGKAGVWSHFGSWDFERASIWINVGTKKLSFSEGVKFIKDNFNYGDKEAEEIYYKVQELEEGREANTWISPWPSYAGSRSCEKTGNNTHQCVFPMQTTQGTQNVPFIFDSKNYEVYIDTQEGKLHPISISYIKDNKFHIKEYSENKTIPNGLSMALIQKENGDYEAVMMQPPLVGSMFTRLFYFKDETLKHFEFFDYQRDFSGLDIYTWKINWEGKE